MAEDSATDRRLATPAGRPRAVKMVRAPATALRAMPRPDCSLDTELLHGERVDVFEEDAEGWALVRARTDGYVGWCSAEALAADDVPATHVVAALRTHVYPAPDIKTPPLDCLSIGARLTIVGEDGAFGVLAAGGFVFLKHLRPVDRPALDWIALAESFVGTPYLWGGRTSIGLDCSALVQLSLTGGGVACPRDSDMQEGRVVGAAPVGDARDPPSDLADLPRGALLFWPGHVAIALGDGRLLHANAFHMATVIEPLVPAVERIAEQGLALRTLRHLVARDHAE